jgi:hypothetical protein
LMIVRRRVDIVCRAARDAFRRDPLFAVVRG